MDNPLCRVLLAPHDLSPLKMRIDETTATAPSQTESPFIHHETEKVDGQVDVDTGAVAILPHVQRKKRVRVLTFRLEVPEHTRDAIRC